MQRAQTSVQLYEQLQEQGVPAAALQQVRAALRYGTTIFAGRVHGSGRAYLSHGIGVASVLARLDARPDLICAGLLHGAYLRGDFGSWRIPLRWQRPRVRRAVGTETEVLIFQFHLLPWNPESVAAFAQRATNLTSSERQAVLMRLADDLDSVCDGALLYADNADSARRSMLLKEPFLSALAEGVGHPTLGRALADAIAAIREQDVPTELRSRLGRSVVPPASATLRAEARVARALMGWIRQLRRVEGSPI